jgi:hypothetical protein
LFYNASMVIGIAILFFVLFLLVFSFAALG